MNRRCNVNTTDCPYLECKHENIEPNVSACPTCGHWLKRCRQCGVSNRSFANYCRFCGEALPSSPHSWCGYRGNVQRIGLNRFVVPHSPPEIKIKEVASFRFSGRCRSILLQDQYLVAVSDNGVIKALDMQHPRREPFTFNAHGSILAEPALHNGTLFVGAVKNENREKGVIYAFPLGGLSLTSPEANLHWDIDLEGKPVQALLPFFDRLYLNVSKNERREIHVIDNIDGNKPIGPVRVYSGQRSSTLVGDQPTRKVFFLSEQEGQLYINVFDHTSGTPSRMGSKPIKEAPPDFLDYIPVAAIGSKLFAVFGESKNLCRIDIHTCCFDTQITDRVRNYALAGMNNQMVINTRGLYSTSENMQENVQQGENIVSGPVVLRDKAVVVGMKDGKVRFYKLSSLSIQGIFQVFNAEDRVQTLAAYKNYVAVGNPKGEVKVLELT